MNIEKIVEDWFEKYSLEELSNFIYSFVYYKPAKNDKTSTLIDLFLKENEIVDCYIRVTQHILKPNEYFHRATHKEIEMIQNIQFSLLSIYYKRSVEENIDYITLLVDKNKKIDTLKKIALDLYQSLNRSECYFYGEFEDSKQIEFIKSL